MPDKSLVKLVWLKNRLLSEMVPSKETLKQISEELHKLQEKLKDLGEEHDKR